MPKARFNSSGSGPKPQLGVGKTRTVSRPGGAQHKPAGAGGVSGPGKPPRPGGATKAPKGAGNRGGIARPGGAQHVGR